MSADLLFDDALQPTPAAARWSDPSTSFAAAASISPEGIHESQAWVLRVIDQYGPITDDALCQIAEQRNVTYSPSRIRTARSELVVRGRVHKFDEEGRTARGRKAKRWSTTTTEASHE